MQKLTAPEAAQQVATLDDWTLEDGAAAIHRNFHFADFKTAWTFMTEVAAEADLMDHHPEWSNVYDRVSIRLTTHDAGGVTARDLNLAHRIDAAARKTVK